MTRSLIFPLCALLLSACGSGGNPDVYHIGKHGWTGDTIYVKLFRTKDPSSQSWPSKIKVKCLSCNLIERPQKIELNDSGYAHIFIPEASQLVSTRLHVEASGIDTTFIQTQRPPEQATQYYRLASPLIGRVLVEQLALLYSDSTQDSVVTSSQLGDELNIFRQDRVFY